MCCIWLEHAPGQWQSWHLSGGQPVAGADFVTLREGGAALLVWAEVRARVNGEPILGGLRLLDHRDEVLLGAARLIYSAQSAPAVTTFTLVGDQRPPICPVCRGQVRPGMQAVRCPGCGRWFHQLEANGEQPARPCWTYAPTCRFCNHPTTLEGSAWRPDQEADL